MSKIPNKQITELTELEICSKYLDEFLKRKGDEMRRVYNFKIFINAKILAAQKTKL